MSRWTFHGRASTSRQINKAYAFFTAQVGGYTRMAETFKRYPVRTMGKLTSLALFSAILYAMNADDDEYKEKEEWEKHMYWHIKLPGNNYFITIPKPRTWAYIADFTEASLSALHDGDLERYRKIKNSLMGDRWQEMLVHLAFTSILPLVEAYANYSSFRDTHIVRPWDLDLPVDLQYNQWTSEIGQGAGESDPDCARHARPLHLWLHHRLRPWGGQLRGRSIGRRQDQGARTHRSDCARGNANTPGTGRGHRAQLSLDWELCARAYVWAHGAKYPRPARPGRGHHQCRSRGRLGAAAESRPRKPPRGDSPKRKKICRGSVNSAILHGRDQLRVQAAEIRRIYAAPPHIMTPAQKREKLNKQYEKMEGIARRALGREVKSPQHGALEHIGVR